MLAVKAATFPLPVMLQARYGQRLRLACVSEFAATSRQGNAALECSAVAPDNALSLLLRLLQGKIRRDVFRVSFACGAQVFRRKEKAESNSEEWIPAAMAPPAECSPSFGDQTAHHILTSFGLLCPILHFSVCCQFNVWIE